MNRPDVIATVEDWNITRWTYDGARIEAERPGSGRRYEADVSDDGKSLLIEWRDGSDDCRGTTTRSISIPLDVIRWVVNQRAPAARSLIDQEGKANEKA